MERGHVRVLRDVPVEVEKKVVIVGDKGCGKTRLIASFDTESPADFTQTASKELRRIFNLGKERLVMFLQEVNADPEFPFLRTMSYIGASAVLVCFSFNDINSIRSVPRWIEEVREHCRPGDLSIVGCKVDLEQDTPISATEWTLVEKAIAPYKYLECSAKTGEGVPHLVRVVGNSLLNQTPRENVSNNSVVQ